MVYNVIYISNITADAPDAGSATECANKNV